MTDKRKELRRITIDDSFADKGIRVIELKDKKIIEDIGIEEIGFEIFSCFDSKSPDYAPNLNYVIDFKGVEYISGAFLGKLLALDKRVKNQGGKYVGVMNVHPEIRELFGITKLNRIFDIKNNIEDYIK